MSTRVDESGRRDEIAAMITAYIYDDTRSIPSSQPSAPAAAGIAQLSWPLTTGGQTLVALPDLRAANINPPNACAMPSVELGE